MYQKIPSGTRPRTCANQVSTLHCHTSPTSFYLWKKFHLGIYSRQSMLPAKALNNTCAVITNIALHLPISHYHTQVSCVFLIPYSSDFSFHLRDENNSTYKSAAAWTWHWSKYLGKRSIRINNTDNMYTPSIYPYNWTTFNQLCSVYSPYCQY